ncbi:MAG: isochorismatase family protein [Anaerovoracaceae bacterium]
MSRRLMQKDDVVAVALDFQEKLVPAMRDSRVLEATVAKLMTGLKILRVPILVTQQYTKGLGATTETISQAIGDFDHIEKTTFSAMREEAFVNALQETGARTVLLLGLETHICVEQTAMELLDAGYKVVLVTDCCSSRKKHDKRVAVERMMSAGVDVTTYEAALFELLGGSREEGFKEISRLVK